MQDKNDKFDNLDENKINNHNTDSSDSSDSVDSDFVMEDEEQNPSAMLKKLRQKLATVQKEKEEYLTGWQRSKADFVNAKKQLQADMTSVTTFAESGLISELLPVLDSFYAAKKNKAAWENIGKEWRQGVEYIEQQLIGTLKSHGLEIIDPLGKKFNHEEHEAVEEKAGEESGSVTEVHQTGYKLKGKLLRPARVVVGK